MPSRLNELLEHYSRTLSDGRLSRGERRAIEAILADAGFDTHQKANLQSRLFKLAKSRVKSARAHDAFDWLQDALKTIPNKETRQTVSKVFFSPGDRCLKAINSLIGMARQKVDICVFTITDNRITDAIKRADRHGIRIRVITDNDKSHDAGSDIQELRRSGIPVRMDPTPDHMHHKFAVVDNNTVITGSYNWTRSAATRNFENLLVTDEPKIVKAYVKEFTHLWREFA
ncbi:MAG: endonuclease [Verrucomicrobiales bacterium]|nr:endonuclease [Verrucomicrobiales bacterium]